MEEETIELYFEKLEVCKACRTWGERQREHSTCKDSESTHIFVFERLSSWISLNPGYRLGM